LTNRRRMIVRIQGATTDTSPSHVIVVAAPKTGNKAIQMGNLCVGSVPKEIRRRIRVYGSATSWIGPPRKLRFPRILLGQRGGKQHFYKRITGPLNTCWHRNAEHQGRTTMDDHLERNHYVLI
jgi:hypothetical protein